MKIKLNIKSIIFMTIISIASLLFINNSFATNIGKISVETAKLRQEPNTESKVIELVSNGEQVEILEDDGQWYKVTYKKMTGYIRKDLIKVENEEQQVVNSDDEADLVQENQDNNESEEQQTSEGSDKEDSAEDKIQSEIVKGQKYKITENIKLKIIPLISAIEINDANKDEQVEVIEILNDWAKIKKDNETEGWIIKEKLVDIKGDTVESDTEIEDNSSSEVEQTQAKTMYVNTQTINVREKASTSSSVIKQLTLNEEVTVLSTEDGWAYVDINGTKGYISLRLLSDNKQETSRSTALERTNVNQEIPKIEEAEEKENTDLGNSVVSYAMQFIGYKYVYGGTTTKGFDCSGFTQYVYKNFGVTLNRTAAAQYSNGTSVKTLKAGDLVMFGKSGINHVGIYIGENRFVHAANSRRGVTTDTLASGYYKDNYVGARRIF